MANVSTLSEETSYHYQIKWSLLTILLEMCGKLSLANVD